MNAAVHQFVIINPDRKFLIALIESEFAGLVGGKGAVKKFPGNHSASQVIIMSIYSIPKCCLNRLGLSRNVDNRNGRSEGKAVDKLNIGYYIYKGMHISEGGIPMVIITDSAREQFKQIMQQNPDKCLRVIFEGFG